MNLFYNFLCYSLAMETLGFYWRHNCLTPIQLSVRSKLLFIFTIIAIKNKKSYIFNLSWSLSLPVPLHTTSPPYLIKGVSPSTQIQPVHSLSLVVRAMLLLHLRSNYSTTSLHITNLFYWYFGVHQQAVLGVILNVIHKVHPLVQRQLGRVVLGKGVDGISTQSTCQFQMLLQQVGGPAHIPRKQLRPMMAFSFRFTLVAVKKSSSTSPCTTNTE